MSNEEHREWVMITMEYERDEVELNENFHSNKYSIHNYVRYCSKNESYKREFVQKKQVIILYPNVQPFRQLSNLMKLSNRNMDSMFRFVMSRFFLFHFDFQLEK